MLLSCLRGLDVAYILSTCKGKAFGWFPQVFWLFSLPERRFLCFEADLDGFLSQMMCTSEFFCPIKRTALRSLMQRAAMAVAMRCGGRCSALRHPLLMPLGRAAGRLLCGFSQASSLLPAGLGGLQKLLNARLLVVCETGVCVVRGRKTSSGKAALTAFLPACCFILSGLHACAPGVPAGL